MPFFLKGVPSTIPYINNVYMYVVLYWVYNSIAYLWGLSERVLHQKGLSLIWIAVWSTGNEMVMPEYDVVLTSYPGITLFHQVIRCKVGKHLSRVRFREAEN